MSELSPTQNIPKSKSTVLVVDDEPINIQLLQRKLEWDGITVLTATNGEACLEVAKEERPDLILLDVMMPGMDGFAVCAKLREDKRTNAIPVIFVTAHNSKKGKLEGLEAGAVDYITKPIDLDETIARVRTQLSYLAINKANVELTRRLGESRRSAAIGALTQGIAHNLNNLLGVVMGYLELAKVNYKDPDKVLKNIARVESASNRIVGIIKQLSTVAFTTRLPLHEMGLERLISGSLRRAREETNRDYDVEVQNQVGEIFIKTNIEAFEDALSKLIINAWESYGPDYAGERPINLEVEQVDQEIEFSIVDEGRGIDPEVEENMFEPFISTKNTVGVGMGLTVARHAIRTLGGEIHVLPNEDGQGVTAKFSHPINREES
ncbi:hybrid sensor histidine kinase/response regulator [Pelagicoccus sp. SDUM812002]|uniref:hybrid sensor histidine kinase/response regulator n=1 Tax=Pelagicoccus sp. SDUM812002 TaxID=3041266 RepID=UPI00281003F9|nr:hybrid sensor histidine kinase/response regulator [Pelagicoccus sp. SDUM812002]MDQ8187323.1 hybrid sensor histidine kinase/response regulator [Pelagicoccus sp. SDUM812002]